MFSDEKVDQVVHCLRGRVATQLQAGGYAPSLLEDACQEAVIGFYVRLALGSLSLRDREELFAYLLTAVRYWLTDEYRRGKTVALIALSERECGAAGDMADAVISQITVQNALQRLKKDEKSLLQLIDEGWTPTQIATILNISREAVYKRLQRVKPLFQNALDKQGIEDPK